MPQPKSFDFDAEHFCVNRQELRRVRAWPIQSPYGGRSLLCEDGLGEPFAEHGCLTRAWRTDENMRSSAAISYWRRDVPELRQNLTHRGPLFDGFRRWHV